MIIALFLPSIPGMGEEIGNQKGIPVICKDGDSRPLLSWEPAWECGFAR